MIESPIPNIPTPPLPGKSRDIVYGLWSWSALILGAVIAGWAFVDTVPRLMYGILTGVVFIGSGAGFMAKNNVTRA